MNNNQPSNASNQPLPLPNCLRCGVTMQALMQMPVRVGGKTGFFQGFGEMDERLLVLDTYRCPNCRKLEFFDLDASLPRG